MSNGVELIIASERFKHSDTHKQIHLSQKFENQSFSKHIQKAKEPVTFAPSTLVNHMILALPTAIQETIKFPINGNKFTTKTCLTTYTYHTTYFYNGSTTIENMERVVSNRHTEERNYFQDSTYFPLGLTLLNTPDLIVGVFPTTYHYYNKLKNNELVATSSFTIINTVTGPEDYISFLQPSEEAAPLQNTNTYYSRITKSIQNDVESTTILTDESILTQVVITESLPPRGSSRIYQSYLTDNGNKLDLNVNIYATKTFLTTITYVVTPSYIPASDTEIKFDTQIIKRIKTDIVPSSLLTSEQVSMIRNKLMKKNVKNKNDQQYLITLATLLTGQTLEVTAVSIPKDPLTSTTTASKLSQIDLYENTGIGSPKNGSDSLIQFSSSGFKTKHSVAIKPSSVKKGIPKSKTEKGSEVVDNFNLAESEIQNVYIKPLNDKPTNLSLPTVEQLIGSFQLQRFQPVFEVVADLLQNQIFHRQTQQHLSVKPETNIQSITSYRHSPNQGKYEGQNYIPLQIVDSQKLNRNQYVNSNILSTRYSNDNNSFKNEMDLSSLNRLSANSLHINPPQLNISDIVLDGNNNIYQNYIQSLRAPPFDYKHSVLTKGISIRPGEIINANADVIIGKPNGIDAQFLRPSELFLTEQSIKSTPSNVYLPSISNKKAWIPSLIPISLIPPHSIHLADSAFDYEQFNRLRPTEDYNTLTLLRPPSQISFINYEGSLMTANRLQSAPLFSSMTHPRSPMAYNKPSYYSFNDIRDSEQQQIVNLKSVLSNNEILKVKQIPQIFSNNVADVMRDIILASTQYMQINADTKPSAHHNINLNLDVLSHNIEINVPPLTFKRDNENFPLATAIQGQNVVPPMPLVKIPLNKAHVEVRLTPQSTQLAVDPLERFITSTFQQRNENLSKAFLNGTSMYRISSSSPLESRIKKPNRNLLYFDGALITANEKVLQTLNSTTKYKKLETDDVIANNKQLVYFKVRNRNTTRHQIESKKQDDQIAEYSTFNLKDNLPNRNSYLMVGSQHQNLKAEQSSFMLKSTPDILEVKPWVSMAQLSYSRVGLGKPFVKLKQTNIIMESASAVTNLQKIYFATGEGFNLSSQLISEANQPFADSTEVYGVGGVPALLPSPFATSLTTDLNMANTLIHITQINSTFGLKPSLPSSSLSVDLINSEYNSVIKIGESKTFVTSSHPLTETTKFQILPTGIPMLKIQSNALSNNFAVFRNSLRIENKYSSTAKIEYPNTQNIRTVSAKLKPIPNEYSTLKTNKLYLNDKPFSKSNSNKESRPIISSNTIEQLLSPTNTKKYNTYTNSINALLYLDHSPGLSLESSEVVLPTELNINIDHTNRMPVILKTLKDSNQLSGSNTKKVSPAILELKQLKPLVKYQVSINKKIINQPLGAATLLDFDKQIVPAVGKSWTPDINISFTGSTTIKVDRLSKESTVEISADKMSETLKTTFTSPDNIRLSISKLFEGSSTTKSLGNVINDVLEIDYNSQLTFELPVRDEEITPYPNSNSVMLGGVLTASTSKTIHLNGHLGLDVCNPSCKSIKNEICVHESGYINRCECRVGFARIFQDRPCKPTYTYELRISASRIGSYLLKFHHELLNNLSSQYRHLSSIIIDAIDRMIMQSDLRDEYHRIQLREFSPDSDGAVTATFLLQLSENNDENRLETVFKKYLRQYNYSIGGTELHTTSKHVNSLTIQDFNECESGTSNDCYINAECINLVGSYTCICPEGYADISENQIYPGRLCSDKLIGCDKCNYHGNCVSGTLNGNGSSVCECFAWYTGVKCELNLKILLICLVVIVSVFIVLLIGILFIYTRRKVKGGTSTRPIFITTSNYQQPSMLVASRNISQSAFYHERSLEKHGILNDSHSESSQNSDFYLSNLNYIKASPVTSHHEIVVPNKQVNLPNLSNINVAEGEQSDRSLTVMIPRARYFHPTVLSQAQLMTPNQQHSLNAHDPTSKSHINVAYKDCDIGTEINNKSGALVSAGFEVSAIVTDRGIEFNETNHHLKEMENKFKTQSQATGHRPQKQQKISQTSLKAILRSGEEIQRMSTWMGGIQKNAISPDVRSFDETTVQAVTKLMHLSFDMQPQITTSEEPNTMTERDLGSTFLLPHTHLYMPEKLGSDVSGFDSI